MWYNTEEKEAERPFSPCRTWRARVNSETISEPLESIFGRGVFVRLAVLASRTIFFYRRYTAISAKELLINEDIKANEVRVIDAAGEPVGIMSTNAALQMAYDKGLDLVLMAPQAQPPVARMMDYGKYRFECEKKEKEAKKKQQTVELKEIQLSYRIDTHDFETKARHAHRFLESGNKVRVVMRFKGREMSHMPMGREVMTRFCESVADVGTTDKPPVVDGRFMSMVLAPIKNK